MTCHDLTASRPVRRASPLRAAVSALAALWATSGPVAGAHPAHDPSDGGVEVIDVDVDLDDGASEPAAVVPVHVSLVPGLALPGGAHVLVDGFSFGLVADRVGALRGLQLTMAFGVVDGGFRGAQVTAGVNLAEDLLDGLQLAAGANIATGYVGGTQIAAGLNLAGEDLDGAQIAGGANIAAAFVSGAQVAGGVNVAGDVDGAQVAGGVNVAGGDLYGAQLAGGVNIVDGDLHGAQIAGGVNIVDGDLHGAQIAGGVNLAGDVHGAQIGVINIGRHVVGAQIGVINIADRVDGVSLALLPILGNGYNHVEAWADTSLPLNLGVRLGTPLVHVLLSVGASAPDDPKRCVIRLGGGLGTHAELGPLYLDLDATAHGLAGKGCDFRHYADDEVLAQLRVSVGLPLGDALAVFVGAAANGELSLEDNDLPVPLLADADAHVDSRWGARFFPSFFLGLRIF